jgi:hypothetical protein
MGAVAYRAGGGLTCVRWTNLQDRDKVIGGPLCPPAGKVIPEPVSGISAYPGVSMQSGTPGHHHGRLIGSVEAARAAKVSVNVISNWRNKGWTGLDGVRKKLPIVDYDGHGRPLYRYTDVLNAERETRRSGKSHRRIGPPQTDWDQLDRQAS